jgi:hypothetical protein
MTSALARCLDAHGAARVFAPYLLFPALAASLALGGAAHAQPPASSLLSGALKRYEQGDHHGASRELHRAAEGEGRDSDANRKRAHFFLLRSLHHLGFHAVALAQARKIHEQGSANPYLEASLKWLLALAEKLPDALGAPALAARVGQSALASPALAKERSALTVLVARGLAQGGKEQAAIALLRTVPSSAAERAQARLLLGILLAREGELDRARGALGEASQLLGKPPAPRPQRELALLHLARAEWAAGSRGSSLARYAALGASSAFGPEASVLRAVRALEAKDPTRATEELHRLHGLRFSHGFFPEGLILRAAIYFRAGKPERAEEALKAFAESFGKLGALLAQLAQRERDPGDVLAPLRRDRASGSREARLAASLVLEELTVDENVRSAAELDRELALLHRSPPEWKASAVAGLALQDLTLLRSLVVHQAGALAQRRMRSLEHRLDGLGAERRRLQAAITRCRAAQERPTVGIDLRPLRSALFQPRASAERHDLFALRLELGGCASR